MNNVKAPYNLSSLTSQKAIEAFKSLDLLNIKKEKILQEKERVISILKEHSHVVKVHPSDTNFVLFEVGTWVGYFL